MIISNPVIGFRMLKGVYESMLKYLLSSVDFWFSSFRFSALFVSVSALADGIIAHDVQTVALNHRCVYTLCSRAI